MSSAAARGASWASTWWTPSRTTHGLHSSGRSATAASLACSSSSPTRTAASSRRRRRSSRGGVAALRRPPHARLHARGGLLAAQAPREQDRLAGVPRARRRHRDRHVPRGVRHAGGVLPEGGGGSGGGGARRAGLPRLSADPLEVPAHQQRAGEDQPGDKARVERRAGVPVNGLAGAARGRGHVRAGRDMAGVQVLLGGEDERALRRGAHARNRRPRRLGAAGGGRPGRCLSPASGLRTGSRRHRISTVFQVPGCRAASLRIGLYTNFLDTTPPVDFLFYKRSI